MHGTYLAAEIHEQPDVIRRLLAREAESARAIADAIARFDPALVMIAARGTSDNAARYAQYLLGMRARLPVALATPSAHTLYDSPPNLSRALVIGISQSGQSEDVRRVLHDANAQGALTLSITNAPDSPLAQMADHHLNLDAGEEKSIAATKTYTAELAAIALLTTYLTGETDAGLETLPDSVQTTLESTEPIAAWAERYRYMERYAAIGRGYNYCTAYEISLKIKELAYLTGEEYSEAEFRHGPIAMVERGFPVIAVAPRGKTSALMHDLLGKLTEREAECLVITNEQDIQAHKTMPLPEIPEWLSPVVAVIPGQVFAMNLALTRGHPVDQPRGLKKVTITN